MITQRDEEQILSEYRRLLGEEEERLEGLQREIERLRSIVSGIEGRLQARQPGERVSPLEISPEPSMPPVSVRHGRPTFVSSVRQVMGDGLPRSAAEVLGQLRERGVLPLDGDRTKQMQKIANTFVELKKQGFLEPYDRGVYKLASTEVSTEAVVLERPAGEHTPKPRDEQPGLAGSSAVGAAAAGIGALATHALTAGGGSG